jgi:hypothetical protein
VSGLNRRLVRLLVTTTAGLMPLGLIATTESTAVADDPSPSVVVHAALVAGGPAAPVTLSWYPTRLGGSDADYPAYTVRYRTSTSASTPEWTVVDGIAGTDEPMSLKITLPTAGLACWQVQGSDGASVSDWSTADCFTVDAQAPRVTRTSLETWEPVKRENTNVTLNWWHPPFSWAGSDDSRVTDWQLRELHGFGTSGEAAPQPIGTPYVYLQWTKDTAVDANVEAGDEDCWSVRARDAVGRVSAWSPFRCTYGPLQPREWAGHGTVGGRRWMAVQLSTATRAERTAASYQLFCAKGLRMKVRTGPKAGRAQLMVGARVVGSFSGRAKRVGWRWVTLKGAAAGCGQVRFRALTKARTQIGGAYVLY